MSQARSKIFQVHPLRGIDLRWRPNPHNATLVEDMVWDANDAWKDSGGFRIIREDTPGPSAGGTGEADNDPPIPGDPRNGENPSGGTGGGND